MSKIKLNPINENTVRIKIVGKSPLIQHKWSEKALGQIRDKQAGKKTKNREAREPEKEARDATYLTADGKYGVPVKALKASFISAAHKDLGIEKVLVRKSMFLPCSDPNDVLPMECDEPFLREDYVRVGNGGTDLRYRPEFRNWSLEFDVEYDADMLGMDDIGILINRAGFGVGLCEWRPEKGGDNGRFELSVA